MSKVRSVTLDSWEPELLKVMTELGNSLVNSIYLADVKEPTTMVRATPHCGKKYKEFFAGVKKRGVG